MWKVCWSKGRLYWKIAKLFHFCHLSKLVRPETYGPYHVYPFCLAVTDVTVPTVVVVCGTHVVVDWNFHLPAAALLGPSMWHTNKKLYAKLLRMGLETGWRRQNIYFVPKSPLVNNFGKNTCQMTKQLHEFHSALRIKTKLTNIMTKVANSVPWLQLVNTYQLPLWLWHTYFIHNNHPHHHCH